MTETRKQIFKILLEGGSVAKHGTVYRVRDAGHNPKLSFNSLTWFHIKKLCKPNKNKTLFTLDRGAVKKLSKRYWIKKEWLKMFKRAEACFDPETLDNTVKI